MTEPTLSDRWKEAKDAAKRRIHSLFGDASERAGGLSKDIEKEVADRTAKVRESQSEKRKPKKH